MAWPRLRRLALPSTREVVAANDSRSPEVIAQANRVVVFGSKLSGAYGLAAQFEEFLAEGGIEQPEVHGERDAARIDDAFYGRGADGQAEPTIPRGVIAMHEMRQYTSTGSGMFIPTPHEYIQGLCDRHGVPLVRIAEAPAHIQEAIGAGAVDLLVPRPELPSA